MNAYILAGGKSKRLGFNKALAEIEGKKVIEIIYSKLKEIFDNICISTNLPEEFNFLDLQCVEDVHKNLGPLGGIYSCLSHSQSSKSFFISCDMPFISTNVIEKLISFKSKEEIILVKNQGKLEFMCGVYSKSTLPLIEKIIEVGLRENKEGKNKKLSMWNYVHKVGFSTVNFNSKDDSEMIEFTNLNDLDDLEKIRSLAAQNKALVD